MATVIFYIAEGMLTGKVAGRSIFIAAKTGFGAAGPADLPGAVSAEAARAIPVGKYIMHPPIRWQLGEAVRLQPLQSDTIIEDAKSLSAYRIHGQRLLGCDRSIVPEHVGQFALLMAGLREDTGGRLEVRDRMEGNYPERWIVQELSEPPAPEAPMPEETPTPPSNETAVGSFSPEAPRHGE